MTLRATSFLHNISLAAEGYLPDDNYFHLAPDREKHVRFRPLNSGAGPFHAELDALNLASPVSVTQRTITSV